MKTFERHELDLFVEERAAEFVRELVTTLDEWMEQHDVQTWMTRYQEIRLRLIELCWTRCIPPEILEHLSYIRFGSAARGEDVLFSDLDYGVVSSEDIPLSVAAPYLTKFHEVMERLGFPPCQGFVMGTNPRWYGTIQSFEARVQSYFAFPDWKNARFLFMTVDGNSLFAGDDAWNVIRDAVHDGLRKSPFLCWEMAHLGIDKTVAIDFQGRLKLKRVSNSLYFNIKEGLLHPLVHSIRLLALQDTQMPSSTLARWTRIRDVGMVSDALYRDVEQAILFAWKLRARQHIQDYQRGSVPSDALHWNELDTSVREETVTHVRTAKTLERLVHRTFRKPR